MGDLGVLCVSKVLYGYFAAESAWKIPNVFPSVSMKYPCQHTPGIANFGMAICPPALRTFAVVASKFATSIEHTNAFVPCWGGGVFAGRFSNPPRDPSVSIRQYSIGSPSALIKVQPKIPR